MVSLFKHQKNKNTLIICEDSLTSGVFDLMKYLPNELLQKVLRNSLFHNKVPNDLGNLEQVSFWDKWDASNTSNTNYVEPDVFMRFENVDIILEAKRYDFNQQYKDQMVNELVSYCNEYYSDNKQLIFIEVGGLNSLEDEDDYQLQNFNNKKVKICKTTWSKLLDTYVYMRNEISSRENTNESHIIRLLDDIIYAFELHQFYKLKWLSEIKKSDISKSTFPKFSYLPISSHKWLIGLNSDVKINNKIKKLFDYA